jgi:hypothetical protein
MVTPRSVFTQHVNRRWSWLVARLWTTWILTTPWTTVEGELPFHAATADAMNSTTTFMAFALNIGYCDTVGNWHPGGGQHLGQSCLVVMFCRMYIIFNIIFIATIVIPKR